MGIGFRYYIKQLANRHQIKGNVRYEYDRILIYASGDAENLDRFINQCRSGPPGSRVDEIRVNKADDCYRQDFEIV
ncbi:MAG: acylphosphatase [Bacteroidales bacterium]|nr:acylphosphatase [Bacteroidales bacterium]